MKFKMNNRTWEIKEVDAKWILDLLNEESPGSTYCFGATKYNLQTIFLNKEMPNETKKQTLYHELMHCYIWNYLSNQFEYNEEQLCDISANSHDIIHKIVEDYFKGDK